VNGVERAKLACQSCRRDNKKVRILGDPVSPTIPKFNFSCKKKSAMINDRVHGASLVMSNASMSDVAPSSSNCAVKSVGRIIRNARTTDPASTVLRRRVRV
jgi:hypothetical protein